MLKVASVVVSFDRPDILKRTLESILGQSTPPDTIVVVDNSPNDNTRRMIEKDLPFVVYKHFPENIGSEGGCREGVKLAYRQHDYIWLLDDDCIADRSALSEMLKWIKQLEKEKKIGAVRSARGKEQKREVPATETEDLNAWRGTLISSAAVKNLGLPDDDLFLYAGDMEYGLRMRSEGYRIYVVTSSRIDSIHLSEKIKVGMGAVKAEIYKQPFRIYYAFRNELFVYLKYGMLGMAFRLILSGLKNLCFLILSGHREQAEAVLNGIWDGLKGKRGKRGEYLPSRTSQAGNL